MNKERSIATAFKDWVDRTKEKLKSSESSQKLDEKRVKAILDDAFSETRKGFIQGIGPAVYHSFLEGAVEAGYGMDPDALTNLAYNYAAQVADYANSMSSEAAAEAYIGALKRKQQPKQAFDFMRRSFGSDRRTVKSLLKQLENPEIKDYTIRQKPDQRRKNMDAYIAATVQRRGQMFGDEESFASKQMSMALVWNLAATQGYLDKSARKQWYTIRDERTCKSCGPMHQQTVKVTEKFTLKDGKKVWAPQLHPNCRCEVKLLIRPKLATRKGKAGVFSKAFSHNKWETQPRSATGQFGDRPGSKHKPLYTASSLYRGSVAPSTSRRAPVALLERPTVAPAPSQAATTARFDQLITSLYQAPQLQVGAIQPDADVSAALSELNPAVVSIPTLNHQAAVQHIASVKSKPLAQIKATAAPRIDHQTHIATKAVMATIPQLRTIVLNEPKVTPTTRLDIETEILTSAPAEIKAEVEAQLAEPENKIISRSHSDQPPLYVIIPGDLTGNSLPAGTQLTSNPRDLVEPIYNEYMRAAEEAIDTHAQSLVGEFGMDEWDIREAFEFEAHNKAWEALEDAGIYLKGDDDSPKIVDQINYEQVKEEMTSYDKVKRVISLDRALEETGVNPLILRADETHLDYFDDHWGAAGDAAAIANRDLRFSVDGSRIVFEFSEEFDPEYLNQLEIQDTEEDQWIDHSWYEGESYEP